MAGEANPWRGPFERCGATRVEERHRVGEAGPMSVAPRGFPGMVWVPGGEFAMGSEQFYPEERPVRRVAVDGFWMDEHPVTVEAFARFVDETGYVTVAERPLDPADYPGADPALLAPGSLVFRKSAGPVDLRDIRLWWEYVVGASWRHPAGHGSSTEGLGGHPVVHVAWEDVSAYAQWAGKQIPTEAEWEFASRGGLDGAVFAWGDEHFPGGRAMANTWQGEFPWQNLNLDGYEGTSPAGSFPPNGYGLLDITGNVWEWTSDYYTTLGRDRALVLRTEQPTSEQPRRVPCAAGGTRFDHPPQGHQGRFAPVRPQLLPALPAGARDSHRWSKPGPHTSASGASFDPKPADRRPQSLVV